MNEQALEQVEKSSFTKCTSQIRANYCYTLFKHYATETNADVMGLEQLAKHHRNEIKSQNDEEMNERRVRERANE